MNKTNVVNTERLNIYPLSDSEMENMIVIELDMDMKKAYSFNESEYRACK